VLNFSPDKLFIVGLIAVIVLGPNRLPEAARTLGRFIATFRRLSSGFQTDLRDALAEPKEAFDAAMGREFQPLDVRRSVRDAISSTFNAPAPGSRQVPRGGPPWPVPRGGPPSPVGPVADPPHPPDPSAGLSGPDDPSLN
jgi:sec-independent protein translocase protein TatB